MRQRHAVIIDSPPREGESAPELVQSTDQAHVTPALLPAVADITVVDTGDLSDHQALVVDLDLARLPSAA